MTIITDPLFYLLAIPAIVALGLGKGGFAGVGMISTPLLALSVPPLQAAAILLPIILMPGRHLGLVLSSRLERLEPEGAAAGLGGRGRRRLAVRRPCRRRLCRARGRHHRSLLRALHVSRPDAPIEPRGRSAAAGMFWGALAGFTSTIIQVGAPPFQVHILPQRLDKFTLIGTTIVFFALVNVMKIVPYSALGQFSTAYAGDLRRAAAARGRRPISSASGSHVARRPSCSTRSPTCWCF